MAVLLGKWFWQGKVYYFALIEGKATKTVQLKKINAVGLNSLIHNRGDWGFYGGSSFDADKTLCNEKITCPRDRQSKPALPM